LDFIPQLISDYEIKRPKPSVVESRELGAHEAYNDLIDILAFWAILRMFLMNKVCYEL